MSKEEPNNDVEAGERARALRRVVRAMHDGECPSCHNLFSSAEMVIPDALEPGHRCPACFFTITKEESQAAIREFADYMDRNLEVFRQWREERERRARNV